MPSSNSPDDIVAGRLLELNFYNNLLVINSDWFSHFVLDILGLAVFAWFRRMYSFISIPFKRLLLAPCCMRILVIMSRALCWPLDTSLPYVELIL